MISKYVTYKVKSTELETVTAAIKTFLSQIEANEPDTVYEAYQSDNKLNFMHIMHFSSAEAAEQHSKSDYTNEFVEVLYPRCDVTPVFTDIAPVNGL